MTITKQRVTCQKCAHVFDAELVTDAPISVAIASMAAVHCPQCGSGKCGLGGGYDDAPPLSASVEERAAWWIKRGETGISSQTIWAAFCGHRMADEDTPRDPGDFKRCRLLLLLIPEWRADLQKVVTVFPWYAPLVNRWEEFDAMFTAEKWEPLYDALQSAREESVQIRDAGRDETV